EVDGDDAGYGEGTAGANYSDESASLGEWISGSFDSIVAFASANIRPWAEGLTAIRDAAGRLPALPRAFWLSGIVVLLTIRFHRARQFRSVVKRGRPAPSSIRKEVRSAAASLGLTQVPDIIVVKDRVSPMIWFDGRP